MIFNDACNTRLFEAWVQQVLINELKPAQFVVIDNAAFHKSKKTKELIESVGCKVIFLLPYSPDLNSIEKFSANMKLWIRNQITQFANSIISFFYAQTNDYNTFLLHLPLILQF
ncbi:transposase [Orientia tsutsugamushi]|uniref:transposase n=1 Tax=Orientia tsutsugamushi TaxID=784 RepID=UPI00315C9D0D